MGKTQRNAIPGALTSSRHFALSRLARMAVRQRRFALIVTLGGMAATAPFLIMSKPHYTETTTAQTKPQTLSSETSSQVSVASRQSCKQPPCEATGVQARALSYATADAGATSSAAKWPAVLWAGLLWGLAGLGLGMVRELFDKRIRTSEDVTSSLGVPCVATIPVIEPALCEPGRPSQKGFLGPVLWRCDDELDETLSRALFALRRWAFRNSPGSSTVVLVVAAHPSEGCSTVAAQLALYAAGTATSTVLVDADLRHCGLTDALDIVHQHTFADVIASGADVKAAIVRSPEFGFDFCPAPDRATTRPLSLLASRGMCRLFDDLRSRYALVVIDTTSMADHIDAEALIEHADHVLVVIKAGQTTRNDAADMLGRLQSGDRAPVIGVALNMACRAAKRA